MAPLTERRGLWHSGERLIPRGSGRSSSAKSLLRQGVEDAVRVLRLTLLHGPKNSIVATTRSAIQAIVAVAWEGTTMATTANYRNISDAQRRAELHKAVIAATVGTTIEWYDFFIYGTAAGLVFPKLFFPKIR